MVKFQLLAALSFGGVASVLASPYTKYPTLAEVKKKFYSEEIVPDVLPLFNPTSFIYLTYTGNLSDGSDSKVVLPGTNFVRNDTLYRPEISVQGAKGGPYVIAMVDPDPKNFDASFLNISNIFNFNISNFAERTGLGKPLAGTFLTVEQKNTTAT
ncbi:hypothetical protein FRC11_007244 [Ceratobasidium sp. 423]|nr:hypothetical protein FRC11_007244 [Ceratobasidium sp. 423]